MNKVKIDDDAIINDVRIPKDFIGKTFSGFKKTSVLKELVQSIVYCKIEDACYWCIELLCSGHFIDIWDTFFKVMSNHIHIGNPKLPIYIEMRCNDFKKNIENGYLGNEIELRNNINIRIIFMEIVCILAYSQKRHTISCVKLNDNALDVAEFGHLLSAKSTQYCEKSFRGNDPKEIYIPLNELAYHVSKDSLMSHNAAYWLEWLYYFDSVCKKNKKVIICDARSYVSNNKLNTDIVWIIWDIMKLESTRRKPIVKKIIDALASLFCLRFTIGARRKRKHLLYYAISILCSNSSFQENIIQCSNIDEIVNNSHKLFKKIKSNEIQPKSSYLFKNLKEVSSREKSAKKLEILNKNM